MRTTLTIDQIINEWISEQNIRVNSSKTYYVILKNLYSWCSKNGKDKRSLKIADVMEYRLHVLEKYSTKYAGSILTVIKMFFRWLESKNYHDNVTNTLKLPKQKPQFSKEPLNDIQVLKLFSTIDHNTKKGQRDYLMIILMLVCGLRCVEISRMNISDIFLKDDQFCMKIQRKGHNEKDDFIDIDDLMDEINRYLNNIENKDKNVFLFRNYSNNNNGNRLSPLAISKIVSHYFVAAGIKSSSITPHSLRHTAAVTLLRRGENLENIQLFLGHTRPEITKIYTLYANYEIKMQNRCGKILRKHFLGY